MRACEILIDGAEMKCAHVFMYMLIFVYTTHMCTHFHVPAVHFGVTTNALSPNSRHKVVKNATQTQTEEYSHEQLELNKSRIQIKNKKYN